MRRVRRALELVFAGLLLARVAVGCGARTGLLIEPEPDAAPDGAPDIFVPDAQSEDVRPDVFDSGRDVRDASIDDGLPPIDTSLGEDVGPLPGCTDAGATQIYVVTEQNELLSLYPPTLMFTPIGTLSCNDPGGSTPFSMGVNRIGVAYVVFSPDGLLYKVSTLNAACAPLPMYVPGQQGFQTFGMSFVANPADGGDSLYIAASMGSPNSGTLGTIDTSTFLVNVVGPFQPLPIAGAELTGTGAGRLFTFYSVGTFDSAITEVDPLTGNEIATDPLPGVEQGSGWAFAYWGGDFYLFTAPMATGTSQVTRFRPSDHSITVLAVLPPGTIIVGAGVSTCAPQG